jgi:hypothetical protein
MKIFKIVIARPTIVVEDMFDRAIQRKVLDYPVKPDNDKTDDINYELSHRL